MKLQLDSPMIDVGWKDFEYRQTRLWWAAQNGHEAIGKLLLDCGNVDSGHGLW